MILWRKTGRKRCDYERIIRVVFGGGGGGGGHFRCMVLSFLHGGHQRYYTVLHIKHKASTTLRRVGFGGRPPNMAS